MNSNDALLMVFSRNAFYKRMHYLVFTAFILSLITIFFLFAVLMFVIKNPSMPIYFATDRVGQLIEIVPVDKPNMSNDEVAAWAVDAIQSAFSYDYVNYPSQLQHSQKFFTDYGWSNYMKSLTTTNNLVGLKAHKWIVIAQVLSQPKVIAVGSLAGKYAWKFTMPMLITYWAPPYNDTSKFSNSIDMAVLIQRQPILQSNKGLGIVQVIATFTTNVPVPSTGISTTPTG